MRTVRIVTEVCRTYRGDNVIEPEHAAGQRADRRALAEINDLIDDGVYDAASVLAWEVQRSTPGDPAIWLLLARIDYLRQRFAAAMYAARMATRLDPASSDGWLALAMTAVTRPRWQTEGLDAALQATALAPADVRTWTVLSQLQLVNGAVYEAAVAAEQAVRVDPSDRGGHLMLGETALDAGEPNHAEAAFRRVLELESRDNDGRLGLAEALEAQGIDPADELARYGSPAATGRPRSRLVDTMRAGAGTAADLIPSTSRAMTAWVIGGTVMLGLLVGAALPAVGIARGLIGATALILMWVAVGPLRTVGSDKARPDAAAVGVGDDEHDVEADAGRVAAAVLGDASLARELAVDVAAHEALQDASDEGAPAQTVGTPPATDRDDVRTCDPAAVHTDSTTAAAAGSKDPTGVPDAASTFDMPDDPDQLAELSRARLAVSDLELAHAAASRLEAVAPGTLEAHRALGAVALAEQNYEQARLHYRRVLELEPLDQEAHERLALVGGRQARTGARFNLRVFRNM